MSTYLGQNFLKDAQIITAIATAITKLYHTSGATALIEIGPGKGAITKKIFQLSDLFFVIEKDEKMQDRLIALGLQDWQTIFGDILKTDIAELLTSRGAGEGQAIVVGNLPYYITSPIFRHLFWKEDPQLLGGFFMVQEEVGEKIKTDASKKSYLWWLVNRAYQVEYVKTVPAKCFTPAPKVKSCLLRFRKKEHPESVPFFEFEHFLNYFSPYSRKTLGKIAKMLEKKEKADFPIPLALQSKRLEELSWEELKMIFQS